MGAPAPWNVPTREEERHDPQHAWRAVMSLEHIFYLSQSIVAVIASLLYLAQQVRQAERVQRATMQQGRADRTSQASLATANPELARVFQARRETRS
jgi:hypothetical protein